MIGTVRLLAEHAALSDIGLQRSSNEDSFIDQPPLFAVADGMGGAQAGEVASRLAVETLRERAAAGDSLNEAAAEANRRIFKLAVENPDHAGMGTTLTALRLAGERAELAHVGDSRAYLLRDQAMTQLTDDHSLVGEWMREGTMTPEEAMASRYRSVLSRALGTEDEVEVDHEEVDLRAGDVLLLCSDGLSGTVPDDKIKAALLGRAPEEAARRLVREAKSRGGHDNITVVVVRLKEQQSEKSAEPADAAAAALDQAATAALDQAATAALDQAATAELAARPEAPVAKPAKRHRRRLLWALVAAAIAATLLSAGVYVLTTSYFVGVQGGYVSVYRGLPYSIAGVQLNRMYLRTSLAFSDLPSEEQAGVVKHTVRDRDAALREVDRLQSVAPLLPVFQGTP